MRTWNVEGVDHELLSLFFVGATRGLDEIKEQPFFKTIDFDVSCFSPNIWRYCQIVVVNTLP